MRIRFWGTRGSLPTPGPGTVRYGGNTSCVEVRAADGTLLVLDAGTGLRGLGVDLLERGGKVRGHLLIGHTHWDHIQGLPFFAPLFGPDNEWDIYAPQGIGQALQDTLAGQMQYTYFPVSLQQLGATIRYHDLLEGTLLAGGVRVIAQYLNHPALTLGYRLEADGVAIVYATDHEPHARQQAEGTRAATAEDAHAEDLRHAAFLAGADLVIHDAQYTAAEYSGKVGWGHSTVEYAVDLCAAAGVKRLALFHHEPLRSDDAVDALVAAARARVSALGSNLQIIAAAEGQILELDAEVGVVPPPPEPKGVLGARAAPGLAPVSRVVLASVGIATQPLVEAALAPDGLKLFSAASTADAVSKARAEVPGVTIVEADEHGLAVCRALRAANHPSLVELPIIAAADDDAAVVAAFAAGATDSVIRPFSPQYLRTKVMAWLLRNRPRWVKAPLPPDEAARLADLHAMEVLDTPAEERFDRITRLTGRVFQVPIAFVGLIDQDRQWAKSIHGPPGLAEMRPFDVPRDVALCSHTILHDEPLVVADADHDGRFGDNPAFTAGAGLKFYAAMPVKGPAGHRVGTLCVFDTKEREFGDSDRSALRDLAAMVEDELRR